MQGHESVVTPVPSRLAVPLCGAIVHARTQHKRRERTNDPCEGHPARMPSGPRLTLEARLDANIVISHHEPLLLLKN
jgi:hypothetical protein